MLKRTKKGNSQKDWISAYKTAYLEQDTDRAEYLIKKAVSRIPRGKSIYGFSGGKDALALQIICEEAGIDDCVLGTIGFRWEYPDFVNWLDVHKPKNLYIHNADIKPEWLNKNEELVFPDNSKATYKWYKICNQSAYYDYAKAKNAEYIICGHRTADGNVCVNKNGKIYPMYDFSHEDIFCILACHQVKLPPIYFYENGFYNGSHAWIMRYGKNAIDEIYKIDKMILENNVEINKIKHYLERKA